MPIPINKTTLINDSIDTWLNTKGLNLKSCIEINQTMMFENGYKTPQITDQEIVELERQHSNN